MQTAMTTMTFLLVAILIVQQARLHQATAHNRRVTRALDDLRVDQDRQDRNRRHTLESIERRIGYANDRIGFLADSQHDLHRRFMRTDITPARSLPAGSNENNGVVA